MADSSATAPMTAADLALKRSGELTNVVVPYRFEAYPWLLYKGNAEKTVVDAAEKAAAEAAGWSVTKAEPVTVDASPSKTKGK